jgi:DNA mismatch endonuclease (patch repair protein)
MSKRPTISTVGDKRGKRAPPPSSPSSSRRMRRVRRANTNCEEEVFAAIRASGIRLRRNIPIRDLRCTPDFLSVKYRLAIFVDGCFWHGCKTHGTTPKANREWWLEKIDSNRRRDRAIVKRLRIAGWTVARFWQHDTAASVAGRIALLMKECNASRLAG